jgi:type IV pilus assembly protein PilW
MKPAPVFPRLRTQRGISLIELMIASSLALIISYFAMSIMMTSSQTASHSSGQAQAQEAARFAISWLQTEARRAGYPGTTATGRIQPFAAACVAGAATPPDNNANCSFNTDTAASDRLALLRIFSTDSGNARDALDCTGVDLSASGLTNNISTLIDVYWVVPDSNTNDGDAYNDILRCVTYDNDTGVVVSPAQTLASGIEALQILYAESPDTEDTSISRYVSADQIANMSLVKSVRISVLTRSWADNPSQSDQRSYVLLDHQPYTFTDGVARQIMTTTVALPNF